MKKLIPLLVILSYYFGMYAGEVTGVVKDASTNKNVEYGTVTIFNSGYKHSSQIQLNGDYSFRGLSAGKYTLAAISDGLIDTIIEVVVNAEGVTNVDILLKTPVYYIETVQINGGKTTYGNKLIDPFEVHPELITTEKEIAHMGHIDVAQIISVNSSVQVSEDNEISIRESRPTATRIMIDGVYSEATVPITAIRYVKVYAGGIPAKYGDTSGGVVVIETKSFYDN